MEVIKTIQVLVISVAITISPMLIPYVLGKVKVLGMKKSLIVVAGLAFLGLIIVGVIDYHNSPHVIDTLEPPFVGFDYLINGMIFAVTWVLIAAVALLVLAFIAVLIGIIFIGIPFLALDRALKPMK